MTPDELRQRLFISVPEAAADVFDVDERTLRRAIKDGQVPSLKVGNKTLIPVPKLLPLLGLEAGSTDQEPGGLRLVGGSGRDAVPS